MHFALQFNFILIAAIEDYQPENSKGLPNEHSNPTRYARCVRMLHNLERAVVFGTPALTMQEESKLAISMSPERLSELYDSEREERASILIPKDVNFKLQGAYAGSRKFGTLLFKRCNRKNMFSSKRWKPRFLSIQERVLNCYRDDKSQV
jgi:hypothetical protein